MRCVLYRCATTAPAAQDSTVMNFYHRSSPNLESQSVGLSETNSSGTLVEGSTPSERRKLNDQVNSWHHNQLIERPAVSLSYQLTLLITNRFPLIWSLFSEDTVRWLYWPPVTHNLFLDKTKTNNLASMTNIEPSSSLYCSSWLCIQVASFMPRTN